jgi:gamma-glutamylcyclotransferase (GGCT)/AIG2-like uncharacterized protein YtfP
MENNKIKIFCYGTLKRNEPNHDFMLKHRGEFLEEAVTVDKWPLIIAGRINCPYLLNKKSYGKVNETMFNTKQLGFINYFSNFKKKLIRILKVKFI